jgi:hypothetical protein
VTEVTRQRNSCFRRRREGGTTKVEVARKKTGRANPAGGGLFRASDLLSLSGYGNGGLFAMVKLSCPHSEVVGLLLASPL